MPNALVSLIDPEPVYTSSRGAYRLPAVSNAPLPSIGPVERALPMQLLDRYAPRVHDAVLAARRQLRPAPGPNPANFLASLLGLTDDPSGGLSLMEAPARAAAGPIGRAAPEIGERIVAAATKLGDRIGTGAWHTPAAESIGIRGFHPDAIDGYVTDTGHFLTRDEAAKFLGQKHSYIESAEIEGLGGPHVIEGEPQISPRRAAPSATPNALADLINTPTGHGPIHPARLGLLEEMGRAQAEGDPLVKDAIRELSPHERSASFPAFLAAQREGREARRATVRELVPKDFTRPVEIRHGDDVVRVVSKEPDGSGRLRMTSYYEDGPAGHNVFDSYDALVDELSSGKTPIAPAAGTISRWSKGERWEKGLEHIRNIQEFNKPQNALADLIPPAPAAKEAAAEFRHVGESVNGLRVGTEIPNMKSIGATLDDYEILPGVREISMSQFEGGGGYTNAKDKARVEALAEEIRKSGRIDPLIVVMDEKGPYVLEGSHRFEALRRLGIENFPAKIVYELEDAQ